MMRQLEWNTGMSFQSGRVIMAVHICKDAVGTMAISSGGAPPGHRTKLSSQ